MRKEVWIFIIIDKVSEGKVSVIVKMTTTIKKLFSLHQRHEEWTLDDTTPPNIGYNLWKCKRLQNIHFKGEYHERKRYGFSTPKWISCNVFMPVQLLGYSESTVAWSKKVQLHHNQVNRTWHLVWSTVLQKCSLKEPQGPGSAKKTPLKKRKHTNKYKMTTTNPALLWDRSV